MIKVAGYSAYIMEEIKIIKLQKAFKVKRGSVGMTSGQVHLIFHLFSAVKKVLFYGPFRDFTDNGLVFSADTER
jgi:hypothetical protein